jgi:hypothetical protein
MADDFDFEFENVLEQQQPSAPSAANAAAEAAAAAVPKPRNYRMVSCDPTFQSPRLHALHAHY